MNSIMKTKNFSRQHFEIFLSFFPNNRLIFHGDCFIAKAQFLGEIKKAKKKKNPKNKSYRMTA